MMTERFTVPGDPSRIAGLFRILQDVSGHAAACWHASGPELMEKGLMWVVTRYELSLDRALIPGEALDITTWASPVRHMLSQRNYLLADAGGLSLGRAAGSWALVDRETRAMVDWTGRLDAFETEVTGLEPPRPAAPEKLEPQFSRVFTVPASWLDMNGHMNNTRYFDLAQTCIAPEADGLVLKTVRAAFLSEALAGDALTVSWARRDNLWSFSGVKNDAHCFRLSLEFV